MRFAACAFTYATADDDAGTAPGQIPVSRMQGAFRAGSISPATQLFGQFGGGSRSLWLAARVTRLLANAGCDGVCIPLEPELAANDSRLRLARLGFAGFWEVGGYCFDPLGRRTGGRAVDPEEAAGLLGRMA